MHEGEVVWICTATGNGKTGGGVGGFQCLISAEASNNHSLILHMYGVWRLANSPPRIRMPQFMSRGRGGISISLMRSAVRCQRTIAVQKQVVMAAIRPENTCCRSLYLA